MQYAPFLEEDNVKISEDCQDPCLKIQELLTKILKLQDGGNTKKHDSQGQRFFYTVH